MAAGILDQFGAPIERASADHYTHSTPTAYRGASLRTQETYAWRPPFTSGESETLYERFLATARVRDLVRNDPHAVAGVARLVDMLVGAMVARSSRQLHHIIQNYGPIVAEAKERAHIGRFASSCSDEIGRLLAVLAAAVRPGGHILEIGTGAGVGTAWLVSGLGRRTDVSLVSTEVDVALLASVRAAEWPDYVAFQAVGDATGLADDRPADLLFLDASEVKYQHLAIALDRLAPGGLIVIDDLNCDLASYETQKAVKDRLRQALSNRADLVILELDWATGVIIAARRG